METPSQKLKVKIQENEYEINFPNNGQLIDIEAMKQKLSQGTVDSMLLGNTTSSYMAWKTISMIATFTILIPDLIKSLRVDNLLELNPIQSKELLNVYMNKYMTWYQKWEKIINDDPKEDKKSPEFEQDEDIEHLHNE